MSFYALAAVMRARIGGATDKLVLLALASRADPETGSCWPSQTTIAEDTELCERTVRSALASLEANGWITREHRLAKNGRSSDAITLAAGIRNVVPIGPLPAADAATNRNQVPVPTGSSCRVNYQEETINRNEDTAAPLAASPSSAKKQGGNSKEYAFESGVIRLREKDYEQWRRAFVHLDLDAELIALGEWAANQPKWFFAVSGALAKKNREIGVRIQAQKASIIDADDAAARAKARREAEWRNPLAGVL